MGDIIVVIFYFIAHGCGLIAFIMLMIPSFVFSSWGKKFKWEVSVGATIGNIFVTTDLILNRRFMLPGGWEHEDIFFYSLPALYISSGLVLLVISGRAMEKN